MFNYYYYYYLALCCNCWGGRFDNNTFPNFVTSSPSSATALYVFALCVRFNFKTCSQFYVTPALNSLIS
jgi:hypothetical protein